MLIDDPLAVRIVGGSGNTIGLRCGAYDVPIRVGYIPAVNAATKTTGNLRLLDYRQR